MRSDHCFSGLYPSASGPAGRLRNGASQARSRRGLWRIESPVRLHHVVAVAILLGLTLVCVVSRAAGNSQVFAWGSNQFGQLGIPSANSTIPVAVTTAGTPMEGKVITQIAAGGYHNLALASDGSLYAWGYNYYGQLGDNSLTSSPVPIAVPTAGTPLAGKVITAISASVGGYYSLALTSDGSVCAWGYNFYGQLGTNTTANSAVPVAVSAPVNPPPGIRIVAIAAGNNHSLALASDGAVYAWGRNNSGQLGNGYAGGQSNIPAAVATAGTPMAGKTIVAIAAGFSHSLAVASDGSVYAWGSNQFGQLGNGTETDSPVPVAVTSAGTPMAGKRVTAIAAGQYHSLALASDGNLFGWGNDYSGELGTIGGSPVPVAAATNFYFPGKTITAMTTGGDHGLAVVSDGTVAAWGLNEYGQLGNGQQDSYFPFGSIFYPYPVAAPGTPMDGKRITGVAAGVSHSVALASDGSVYTWGDNTYGQLGDDVTLFGSRAPVPVGSIGAITAISAMGRHNLALAPNGTVYEWGTDEFAAAGGQTALPVSVFSYKTTVSVAAGLNHSLALASDGALYGWGNNQFGQVGAPSQYENYVYSPEPVTRLGSPIAGKYIVAIAAGGYHSLALASDGTVYAWGWNAAGQLGNGSYLSSTVPVAVATAGTPMVNKTIIAIAAGYFHSLALASDGSVYAWGDDSYGQLGSNLSPSNNPNSTVPIAVASPGTAVFGKTITAIAAGGYHSLALASDGSVFAWGDNEYGQLGDNTTDYANSVPGTVATTGTPMAGKTITAIAAGEYHSLALASDGTAYAWGDNADGQLGNNTFTNSAVPVAVVTVGTPAAGKFISAIAAGEAHSVALFGAPTWQLVDVAVGSDGNPRLLWTSQAGVTIVWTVDPTTGNFNYGPAYGPDLPYRATGIACGADGKIHVILNDGSGDAALWEMDGGGNMLNYFLYGPYAGWTATDVSVGSDGSTRLLWTSNTGAMTVWTVNDSTGAFTYGPAYGPYLPYRATGIACGPDGKTRLLWNDGSGDAALWEMGADNTLHNFYLYGAYPGWTAHDVTVGSDGSTHLLWSTGGGSTAIVWTINDSDGTFTYGPVYGPYAGARAVRLAGGAIGPLEMVWQLNSEMQVLWQVGNNGVLQNYEIYGPY